METKQDFNQITNSPQKGFPPILRKSRCHLVHHLGLKFHPKILFVQQSHTYYLKMCYVLQFLSKKKCFVLQCSSPKNTDQK